MTDAAHGQRRFLTFRVEKALYALPAEDVAEVIRMPAFARVPQGPAGLLGVANVRGAVLPLASVRALLGRAGVAPAATARAIVLDTGQQMALAVDAVERVVDIDADRVETRQAELGAADGERLTGAFEAADGQVAKILDIETLLKSAFENRRRDTPRPHQAVIAAARAGAAEAGALDQTLLVTFDVAGQEFGMELADVEEILPAPEAVAAMPRAEQLVLGMSAYRGSLLPLLSLRGLLGLPGAAADELAKVVVTRVGGALVGLVADRMRSILRADRALIEPVPQLLSARIGGEAQVTAIYRGEGGRRLVSVLAPERLFRDEVMKRLESGLAGAQTPASEGEESVSEEIKIVVFRLGDDEFGLPIEAVDEVAEAPAKVTRVPKAPDFLEGVINLRGEVLPIIDQRRRFDMAPLPADSRRRLIVVRSEGRRAGLLVDAVSEVARASQAMIGPAPDLNDETSRLVSGVLNLEASGRIILVLDPGELMSRAERGLLDKFATRAAKALS